MQSANSSACRTVGTRPKSGCCLQGVLLLGESNRAVGVRRQRSEYAPHASGLLSENNGLEDRRGRIAGRVQHCPGSGERRTPGDERQCLETTALPGDDAEASASMVVNRGVHAKLTNPEKDADRRA